MFRSKSALPAAIGLLLFCFRLAPAQGDTDFEAARLKSASANPPGVSLTLSLPGGRTQFHRGEVIPLTAAFASSLPKLYQLNTDPGSRNLLWNTDAFQVDAKTGEADPLLVYYDHEFGRAYSGPGPRFQPLTDQPAVISYTLNEWLRFDAPVSGMCHGFQCRGFGNTARRPGLGREDTSSRAASV